MSTIVDKPLPNMIPSDAVPEHVADESTQEVARRLMRTTTAHATQADPDASDSQKMPVSSAEDIIAQLVSELRKSGDGSDAGDGGKPPPVKEFLGNSAQAWGGWLLKAIIAAAATGFAWYTWVNDSIAERPTKAETRDTMHEFLKAHENHGAHPKYDAQLKAHADDIRLIKDSQIRQEGIDRQQTQVLQDIKQDLRDIRGASRRRNRDRDED